MPTEWQSLINFGVPMVILAGIGFGIWKLAVYCTHRLLDDGGYVGVWIEGERKWRSALTERIEGQQDLCSEHANCIKALTDSVKLDTAGTEVANRHLERLVELHEQGSVNEATKTIAHTDQDMQRVKQAFCQTCSMFREVSAKEFPSSADRVAFHCDAIERIIEDG